MKRRDFITLLGGAGAWPLAAQAQPRERMRRIGVLVNFPTNDTVARARIGAFQDVLQQLGWRKPSICARNIAGLRVATTSWLRLRKNWSRSRRRSSWGLAVRPWWLCEGQPARYPSYSRWSLTQSTQGL